MRGVNREDGVQRQHCDAGPNATAGRTPPKGGPRRAVLPPTNYQDKTARKGDDAGGKCESG